MRLIGRGRAGSFGSFATGRKVRKPSNPPWAAPAGRFGPSRTAPGGVAERVGHRLEVRRDVRLVVHGHNVQITPEIYSHVEGRVLSTLGALGR